MTTRNLSDAELIVIFDEAFKAAKLAETEYAENNPWYPCGFASVVFKDNRTAVNKQILRLGLAKKSFKSGSYVYQPGRTKTQSMHAKEAGCEAFRDVLSRVGIECSIKTVID